LTLDFVHRLCIFSQLAGHDELPGDSSVWRLHHKNEYVLMHFLIEVINFFSALLCKSVLKEFENLQNALIRLR